MFLTKSKRHSASPLARLLVGAVAVGALAACSSNDTAAPPDKPEKKTEAAAGAPAGAMTANADTFDACAVLDRAEPAEAVGADVELAKLPSSGWMAGQCSMSTADAGLLASVGVGTEKSIRESADPRGMDAATRVESFASRAGGSPKTFTDIGEGAVLAPTGIAVHKDGVYVEVANLGMSDDQLVQVARDLAAQL